MADSAFGLKEITIDLATTGARTIRDATKGNWLKVDSIIVSGDPGATGTALVFRKESATGPIVFKYTPVAAGVVNDELLGPSGPIKGLYLDNVAVGWAAGAVAIIKTV